MEGEEEPIYKVVCHGHLAQNITNWKSLCPRKADTPLKSHISEVLLYLQIFYLQIPIPQSIPCTKQGYISV